LLFIGLIISLAFLSIKALGVYMARHGMPDKEGETDDESEQSESQFEGGSSTGSYVGPRVEDLLN
jgi:hypothetical protein|tara:strand:- start:123 stop:317 length:195 start_codon:yes stop_codon:yes gene_type:complete